MPRWFRLLFLLLVASVLLYALGGFFLVPYLLRTKGLPLATENLTAELQVEHIHFNPFTLSIRVQGVSLAQAEQPVLAEISQVYLDLSARSILHLRPIVSELSLSQPRILLQRGANGSFNWADLAKPTTSPDPSTDEPEQPPHFILESLSIADGIILIEDKSLGSSFQQQLGPISFNLIQLDTSSLTPGSHALTASTPEGGTIEWNGEIQLFPFAAKGRLQTEGLALERASPYISTHLGWSAPSATLSWGFHYTIDTGGSSPIIQISEGRLDLTDLALLQEGTETAFFKIDEFSISDITADLSARTLSAGSIKLDGPTINANRNEAGQINLAQLIPMAHSPSSNETTQATDPERERAKPWEWTVEDFSISEGTVIWTDNAFSPAEVHQVHLSLVNAQSITSDLAREFPISLAARLADAGALHIQGQVAPAPLQANLSINLEGFDPGKLGAYWSPSARLEWHRGTFSTNTAVNVSTNTQDTLELRTKSDLNIRDLLLHEPLSGKNLISGSLIQVADAHFDLIERRLQIDRILLEGMAFNLQRDKNGALNLPTTPPNSSESKTSKTNGESSGDPPKSTGLEVSIAKLQIVENQIRFNDASTAPAVALRLENVGGHILNIDSDPLARAELDLSARLQGVSTLHIAGSLNPFPETLFIDLKTALETTDLTLFSPYTAQMLGRSIAKGKLSLELDQHIEDRHLKAKTVLRLDQFEWGGKVDAPGAPSLPLDLAVTLFKDTRGVINLPIPVEGNLDDPDFSYGALVLQALGNLIVKATTAPLRFLAGSLLPKGIDPELLGFAAGQAEASPDNTTIAGLVTMYKARPELTLELRGQFSHQDVDFLKRAELQAAIEAARSGFEQEGQSAATAPRNAILRKMSGQSGEVEIDEIEADLLAQITVPAAQLITLAQRRSEAAQAALIAAGIPSEAVYLLEAENKPQSASGVRISIPR